MKYEKLSKKVVDWAIDRGILEKSNPLRQLSKTQEELDETIKAVSILTSIKAGDVEPDLFNTEMRSEEYWEGEVKDGIGDTLVTIIILAEMLGMDTVDCLNEAYNVIKGRTGKMIDGLFVKDV